MTAPDLAAETILRDVRRCFTPDGTYLHGADVLAALTAALDPALTERAGALTRRLRKTEEAGHVHHLSKADRLAAADLITALLAQNAALRANTVQALDEADRKYSRKTNDLIERHAEQLAALRAERDALVKDKRWIMEERDRTFALMLARAEAAEAKAEKLRGALEWIEALDDHAECCGKEYTECCGQPEYGLDRAKRVARNARAALTTEADNG